jgi:phage terminase small subunit
VSWKNVTKINGELNDKQRVYVAEYLRKLNGTAAAEAAGFSKKSAEDRSKDLQRNPKVRAAIEHGLAEREQECKDKAVEAMEHAYCLATVDIGDLYDAEGNLLPLHQMPKAARVAIASIEVEFETKIQSSRNEQGQIVETFFRVPKAAKIRLHDKRASAELLMKYAGKLKERVELDATQSYADMVLAAQRKREGTETPALPAHADEEPEE